MSNPVYTSSNFLLSRIQYQVWVHAGSSVNWYRAATNHESIPFPRSLSRKDAIIHRLHIGYKCNWEIDEKTTKMPALSRGNRRATYTLYITRPYNLSEQTNFLAQPVLTFPPQLARYSDAFPFSSRMSSVSFVSTFLLQDENQLQQWIINICSSSDL